MGNDYTKIHTGYEVVFSWEFLSGGDRLGIKLKSKKIKFNYNLDLYHDAYTCLNRNFIFVHFLIFFK